MKKYALTLLLVFCCGLSGHVFYKMNGGEDLWPSIIFAVGLTGIVLSVLRNQKSED